MRLLPRTISVSIPLNRQHLVAFRLAGEMTDGLTPEMAVGICSLTIGFSTYRAAPFGVMEDFYIVPEMRQKGVARLLIDHVLADARQKGCRSVMLGCSTDDMPMYKHLGFKTIGNMMARDLLE